MKLHAIALGDLEKECLLISSVGNLGDGVLCCDGLSNADTVVDKCDRPGFEVRGIVKVDLLRKYLPDAVAIAKFDVEGNECLALRGGLELLSGTCRPRLIQTDIWSKMTGCSQDEYLRISDAGYI